MSRGKRRRRHSKAVQQTQSPAPSLPTPVTEPGRQRKRKRYHHKAKKRPPSSSQVYRKDGLNSESPQAVSSNHPPTDQERKNPRSVHNSQVKVQEQRSSPKRSTTPLQRAPKAKRVYESDSEFEFKYINKAQAQLKPRVALRSPPSSPQKVVGLKKTTTVSGNERGSDVRETSADADSESEREREPASPSPSLPSPQRALVENTTPVSNHDRQRTSRGTSLSNPTSESQPVFTPEPEREPSQSPGASLERVVGHEEATPASYPDYGHRTREPSASDIDNEPETASEAEPGHGPESSLSSSSPCNKTALKRKRSNTHHASRRKAAPLPAPSSLDCLPEVESEPTLPSMDSLTCSESALRNFRRDHWRKACEPKEPPLPSRSDLSKVIGPSSPSIFVPISEFQPPESEAESRYASPSPTQITLASSPPVPPTISRVRSRVRSRLPSPQRWLSRLGRPDQKSSLSKTVWTSRLRPTCEIYFTDEPLLIDSMRYPHLSAEFPPDAHGNPEFRFEDNSGDDSDFELPGDFEPPEAKRRRLWSSGDSPETELTERESSLEPEESSEPEQSSEPEAQIDLEPLLLDIAGSSDPQPLPELERSSDTERSSNPESEHPRPPTSIRDQLPVRQSRQLNKRIDEAIVRDKEQNPKFWGRSWMKEYERGVPIKERVEAEYMEEMAKKKEEAERKKREKQERDRILKEKREKKRKEMAEQKLRLEREEQKRMEEEQEREQERQKQKKTQRREELERRRARANKPKNVESALQEMLDERETTDVEISVDPEGLKVAQTAYRLYMRKKAREKEIED
ncbi:hypothetical protein N7519_000301 [Penicillium mononematosum]|uniref:uncharacterized protein n=1 Tax=Penicillium mononematosum TaxID=268346 RepID=UPI0025474D04|nr:uncharacterized protein N7519_000301 [Penicillium mononematosum]KAJ6190280.1 hypothetical protein N7519_000301 [Penicillium mononematosum]